MSSDSDYEEEEIHVFADFKNLLPPEINTHPIKIIGLESDEVIAEINGNIFKGKYDFAVGTNVFFEKDKESNETVDTLFEPPCKDKYRLLAKTNKVINFERIFIDKKLENIDKKDEEETDKLKEENEEKIQSLKINMNYEDAIAQFPAFNKNN